MSEASRSLVASDEDNKFGPNYFGFYIREVADLLLQDADLLSFTTQNSDISREGRDMSLTGRRSNRTQANIFKSSDFLFSNGVGSGLSDFRKERLKRLLRQSVFILSQEVDEMLEPVVATRELQFHLSDKRPRSSYSRAVSDGDAGISPCKKLKMSPSSSTGIAVHASHISRGSSKEGSDSDDMYCDTSFKKGNSADIKKECSRCHTTETNAWIPDTDGTGSLCNACGIKLKKKKMSLSTENEERESLLGSHEAGNDNRVDDLQFLLECDRSQVEEKMKKYSDELSATLGNMEEQLELLLDTIMGRSRTMTLVEKQKLQNLIHNLPPQNLDRVVEIIQRGKITNVRSHSEIHVDLEKEDNLTLWRLYYYVKAVEKARTL